MTKPHIRICDGLSLSGPLAGDGDRMEPPHALLSTR
jgi:hypothetical protein